LPSLLNANEDAPPGVIGAQVLGAAQDAVQRYAVPW